MADKLCASVPGRVMKVRRARGLHEWMAEAGRSVRSIALDMILAFQRN